MRLFSITFIMLISGAFLAAADDGSLTVKTTPEGVEVWIDEKYAGDTPIIDKKLKSGRYNIRLVDPIQHTSVTEEVLIQDDKNVILEKTMSGKFGSLKIQSNPEGANVYLLTSLGKTPVSNDFMNPGKYHVEIRHPNKRIAVLREDVVIPRGETISLEKTLEKSSPLNLKVIARLGFGAGAIAGFAWAIAENGNAKEYSKNYKNHPNDEQSAKIKRNVGIVVGCVCVTGFEIVAFF
jgi:hypothetical protein